MKVHQLLLTFLVFAVLFTLQAVLAIEVSNDLKTLIKAALTEKEQSQAADGSVIEVVGVAACCEIRGQFCAPNAPNYKAGKKYNELYKAVKKRCLNVEGVSDLFSPYCPVQYFQNDFCERTLPNQGIC